MPNRIIPYNHALKALARKLRQQGILAEVVLWKAIKGRALTVEFQRQAPIDEYIVDFYCHELMLAIEVDGGTHEGEDAAAADFYRQQRPESLGVRFLRFTDKLVLCSVPAWCCWLHRTACGR